MSADRHCTVEGCKKAHYARGFCVAHWERNRRHGSPTGGSTSKGAAKSFLRDAIAAKTDDCVFWPFSDNGSGYGLITIGGKRQYVHRLVCEAEHGPGGILDAAHSCGNGHKGCVNPKHLSWKTRIENMADSLAHGTRIRGERHYATKLTEADIWNIRSQSERLTHDEIAQRFGVSRATIGRIVARQVWRHVA